MVLKKQKAWSTKEMDILDNIMQENKMVERSNPLAKLMERGHAERWNVDTVLAKHNPIIDEPIFSKEYEASQKAKLHQKAMEHKEDFYKEKFPESEEIPKGRLDYKDNVFEKMFQNNNATQERANKLLEEQLKQNQSFWNMQQKQISSLNKRNLIQEKYSTDTSSFIQMGQRAGLDDDILRDFATIKRRRAQEEIDELSK